MTFDQESRPLAVFDTWQIGIVEEHASTFPPTQSTNERRYLYLQLPVKLSSCQTTLPHSQFIVRLLVLYIVARWMHIMHYLTIRLS